MNFFSNLISNISLADEKKVVSKIITGGQMLLFRFFNLNYDFLNGFFDLFSEVNSSGCYVMFSNNPKYGSYSRRRYNLEVIMF